MKSFFALADAAMVRTSRRFAAENKRFGLPMIVTKAKGPATKREAKAPTR